MIKPGDCVLDIGANIGVMTYFLSKRVHTGKVIAFEPVIENIHTTRRVIKKFQLGNVRLREIALGAEEGEVQMVMPEFKNARKQGLSHVIHETIPEFNEGKIYTVPLSTLDSLPDLKDCRPSAIKLDVENFEFFVLKGGQQLIQTHRPIIYTELWDNENRYKCIDLLVSWGYTIHVVDQGKLVDWNKSVHKQQNFIFLPQ